MRSRTRKGFSPHLWNWLAQKETNYWCLRRVTSRYILLVPSDTNNILRREDGEYCLIRVPGPRSWPEEEEWEDAVWADEDGP